MTLALWIGAVVLAANVAVVLAGLVVAARRPRRADVPPAHPRRRREGRRAA